MVVHMTAGSLPHIFSVSRTPSAIVSDWLHEVQKYLEWQASREPSTAKMRSSAANRKPSFTSRPSFRPFPMKEVSRWILTDCRSDVKDSTQSSSLVLPGDVGLTLQSKYFNVMAATALTEVVVDRAT